jgi:hypothetical protein
MQFMPGRLGCEEKKKNRILYGGFELATADGKKN